MSFQKLIFEFENLLFSFAYNFPLFFCCLHSEGSPFVKFCFDSCIISVCLVLSICFLSSCRIFILLLNSTYRRCYGLERIYYWILCSLSFLISKNIFDFTKVMGLCWKDHLRCSKSLRKGSILKTVSFHTGSKSIFYTFHRKI